MARAIVQIPFDKRVNLRQLRDEILAAATEVRKVEVSLPARSTEIDGQIFQLPWEIEITGNLDAAEIAKVEAAILAHDPETTSDEEDQQTARQRRLAQFEDIIVEAVRRARQ